MFLNLKGEGQLHDLILKKMKNMLSTLLFFFFLQMICRSS